MNALDWIVEEKIKAAIAEGKFDQLTNHGKHIAIHANPYEPPEQAGTNTILHNHGFTLPWIELQQEIDRVRADLQIKLRNTVLASDAVDLEALKKDASDTIAKLNRLIIDYNLLVPFPIFQRPSIDFETELSKIQKSL